MRCTHVFHAFFVAVRMAADQKGRILGSGILPRQIVGGDDNGNAQAEQEAEANDRDA